MKISDDTIDEYILDLGRRYAGEREVRVFLEAYKQRGWNANYDTIRDALREELLTTAVMQSTTLLSAPMPVDTWENWLSSNDRVKVEAAAYLPTEDGVGEPTDKQLRDLFEEFKGRPPYPVSHPWMPGRELPSPEPGFLIPPKVQIAYLVATARRWSRKSRPRLPKRKSRSSTKKTSTCLSKPQDFGEEEPFDLEIPEAESADDEAAKDSADEMESSEETEAGEEESTAEESEPSSGEADDSEEPQEEAEPQEEMEPQEEPEPQDSVEDDTTGEGEGEGPTSEETPEGNAATASRSPFRLVALQEEATDDGEATAETETEEAAADSEEPPVEESDASADAEDSEPDQYSLDKEEYQPLEEVEEQIRTIIAESRFAEQADETMREIYEKLSPKARELDRKLIAETADLEEEPPASEVNKLAAKLAKQLGIHTDDLKAIAAENQLQFESMEPMHLFELRDADSGVVRASN